MTRNLNSTEKINNPWRPAYAREAAFAHWAPAAPWSTRRRADQVAPGEERMTGPLVATAAILGAQLVMFWALGLPA